MRCNLYRLDMIIRMKIEEGNIMITKQSIKDTYNKIYFYWKQNNIVQKRQKPFTLYTVYTEKNQISFHRDSNINICFTIKKYISPSSVFLSNDSLFGGQL